VVPYEVQLGDTLRDVAARHGVSVQAVVVANGMANPDLLWPGQTLRVPTVEGVLHTLAEGESVRQVAERYGVAIETLVEANGLGADSDLVSVGTTLVVPGESLVARAFEALIPPAPTTAAGPESAAGAQAEASTGEPEPVEAADEPNTLALAALPVGPLRVSDAPPPAVTARYVAIVDEASGALLYGRDEHLRVAPASVTKIATTLVALQREPDLARRVPVTVDGPAMARRDGSSIMGLEPGENVSLLTLLYGLMLPSGNDAAEQVALALGGSRATFVGWMNDLVADVGLKDTHFVNPSGMDASGHYSSAYDMALLGRYAMRDATFREFAAAGSYRGDGYNLGNLNRLIGVYPGADGIKIGSTRAAGKTIVASATRNGRRVYVSLMRSTDLPGDGTALFNWVWRTFAWD
jgi:D-alanyl-D-alanine carboxypeptidase